MIVNAPIPRHEVMPSRDGITRCHVIGQHTREQCTAEALDPDGELLICTQHLAAGMAMVARRKDEARAAAKRRSA